MGIAVFGVSGWRGETGRDAEDNSSRSGDNAAPQEFFPYVGQTSHAALAKGCVLIRFLCFFPPVRGGTRESCVTPLLFSWVYRPKNICDVVWWLYFGRGAVLVFRRGPTFHSDTAQAMLCAVHAFVQRWSQSAMPDVLIFYIEILPGCAHSNHCQRHTRQTMSDTVSSLPCCPPLVSTAKPTPMLMPSRMPVPSY